MVKCRNRKEGSVADLICGGASKLLHCTTNLLEGDGWRRGHAGHTQVAWWLVAPCIVTWTDARQFDRRRGWATEARKVSCRPKGGEGEVEGAGGSGCNGPVALRDARCTSSFGAAALLECAASGDRTACASAFTSAGSCSVQAEQHFERGGPSNSGGLSTSVERGRKARPWERKLRSRGRAGGKCVRRIDAADRDVYG